MQGKGGIGIVRIRVCPGASHSGVVDREELEHRLTGDDSPVNHFLEVIELSHSEVILAPEREHRNCCAGSPPSPQAETMRPVSYDGELAVCAQHSVLTAFPLLDFQGIGISNDEFVFKRLLCIHSNGPLREIGRIQRQHLIPVVHKLAVPDQSQSFVPCHYRHIHDYEGCTFGYQASQNFLIRLA